MLRRYFFTLGVLTVCLLTLTHKSLAQGNVQASLVSEVQSIEAGQTFWVALRQVMKPSWHTYYKDPGESGFATTIRWDLPEGYQAGKIHWPQYKVFVQGSLSMHVYEHEVLLMVPITAPKNITTDTVTLKATADWLECAEICIPGSAKLELTLPVSTESQLDARWHTAFNQTRAQWDADAKKASPESAALGEPYLEGKAQISSSSAESPKSLPYYLLLAFAGGLILNAMPCVFPVIGLKIMGFAQQAGQSPKKTVLHGFVFSAGVILSFWILAIVFISLREAGEAVGWGFQMQNPNFVVALIFVFLVFGLNMSGVFEIGTGVTGTGSQLTHQSGTLGTFFSGVLATVAATPCAAPFLGTALGATLELSPIHAFIIFTFIAAGLAAPYLLLACYPKAIEYLPKPGAWMESLKQGLAFLLYATVAYLIWIVAAQVGEDRLRDILFACVAAATACWAWGRWGQSHKQALKRWGSCAAILLLAGALYLAYRPHAQFWSAWSPERVATLRAEQTPVYIDFTARWCATCQLNKERVFTSAKVLKAFQAKGVVALKADWTNYDPQVTEALNALGKNAVPVNVLYRPGEDAPIIFPEILSPSDVLEALDSLPDVKP